MRKFFWPFTFLIFLILGGCSTEIDINAPEKDIWVLYSILEEGADSQLVRISRGFLPESNAFNFARDSNLSAQGLRVRLVGGGRTLEAVQVDSVVKEPFDGVFFPYTTLYRFDTQGPNRLRGGEEYEVIVTRPNDDEFRLEASTLVPEEVRISQPRILPGGGQQRCLPRVSLDLDFTVEFNRSQAAAFEIRSFLNYEENGVAKQARFGPSSTFIDEVRCNANANTGCYRFRQDEVLFSFLDQMDPQVGSVYTYGINANNRCSNDEDMLPKEFWFELTAMDEDVYNYQLVNDPKFTDFNTVRREYTNVEGPEDAIILGLFGSISKGVSYGQLSSCSEFLLGLNNVPQPSPNCSF